MSQEELKQALDKNSAANQSTIPVVGGIINWAVGLKDRFKVFLKADPKTKAKMAGEFLLNNGLIILLLILIVYTAIAVPSFLGFPSVVNMLVYSAMALIMALGVAGIIVLTGTDLSAGRIMAFLAVITAAFMQNNKTIFVGMGKVPFIVPLLLVMVLGGVFGFINGFFTAKFKLHPFIVTLSTQFMMITAILWFLKLKGNNSQGLSNLDNGYKSLISGGFTINGVTVPWVILYAIVIAIIVWIIWNKTKLGKNMFAVGANPDAATVSGTSVFWTIVVVFSMAGVLYGLSGFVQAAWDGTASNLTGPNTELYAIAGCVIGGVSFTGGVGKIRGVVLGVILLQVIRTALYVLGINQDFMSFITGAIILVAVVIDMRKYKVRR